jgi:hypothetical protein
LPTPARLPALRGKQSNRHSRGASFGLNAIIAKIYKAKNWLDGKECIVLDYSNTLLVPHWIRDEIREIDTGAIWAKCTGATRKLIDFALKF